MFPKPGTTGQGNRIWPGEMLKTPTLALPRSTRGGGRTGGLLRNRRFLGSRLDSRELHNPLQLEVPAIPAQMAVGDQHQLILMPGNLDRIDDPSRPPLAGIEIFHQNRPALIQRFLKLQGKHIFARRRWLKELRPALLAQGIAQTDIPSANRA